MRVGILVPWAMLGQKLFIFKVWCREINLTALTLKESGSDARPIARMAAESRSMYMGETIYGIVMVYTMQLFDDITCWYA